MAIGSVNTGQQFGPAASGPSNSVVARFYRTDLQDELKIAQRDAEAGASDKVAALTPIIMSDAQNAQLPQDIINGPRGLAVALQNGGDGEKLKAAYDLVVADTDAQSLLGPGNPSVPPPQLYNQNNTAGFQNGQLTPPTSPYGMQPGNQGPNGQPPPLQLGAPAYPQPGAPGMPGMPGMAPGMPMSPPPTPPFGPTSGPPGAGPAGYPPGPPGMPMSPPPTPPFGPASGPPGAGPPNGNQGF